MLHVEHQAQVQQVGLLGGELVIVAHGVEEVFRHGQLGLGPVEVQRPPVEVVLLGGKGVGHDHREPGDQPQGLEHLDGQGVVVRVWVVGVQGQHRAGQLVHHVVAGCGEDHVLGEVGGQLPVIGQDAAELLQLLPGGQAAEHQQIRRLLVAEPAHTGEAVDELLHVDAAVVQPAGGGHLFPILHDVALHVADEGDPGHHSGAVMVAQPPLHVVLLVILGGYLGITLKLPAYPLNEVH